MWQFADTLPAMSVEPTSESVAVIVDDVPCASCDYNLRGLRSDGRCSECGKAVVESLALWRLMLGGELRPIVQADRAWLVGVRNGVVWLSGGWLIAAVVATLEYFNFFAPKDWSALPVIISAVVCWFAIWFGAAKVCAGEPGERRRGPRFACRLIRYCTLACFFLPVVVGTAERLNARVLTPVSFWALFVGGAIVAGGVFYRIAVLARRGGARTKMVHAIFWVGASAVLMWQPDWLGRSGLGDTGLTTELRLMITPIGELAIVLYDLRQRWHVVWSLVATACLPIMLAQAWWLLWRATRGAARAPLAIRPLHDSESSWLRRLRTGSALVFAFVVLTICAAIGEVWLNRAPWKHAATIILYAAVVRWALFWYGVWLVATLEPCAARFRSRAASVFLRFCAIVWLVLPAVNELIIVSRVQLPDDLPYVLTLWLAAATWGVFFFRTAEFALRAGARLLHMHAVVWVGASVAFFFVRTPIEWMMSTLPGYRFGSMPELLEQVGRGRFGGQFYLSTLCMLSLLLLAGHTWWAMRGVVRARRVRNLKSAVPAA